MVDQTPAWPRVFLDVIPRGVYTGGRSRGTRRVCLPCFTCGIKWLIQGTRHRGLFSAFVFPCVLRIWGSPAIWEYERWRPSSVVVTTQRCVPVTVCGPAGAPARVPLMSPGEPVTSVSRAFDVYTL